MFRLHLLIGLLFSGFVLAPLNDGMQSISTPKSCHDPSDLSWLVELRQPHVWTVEHAGRLFFLSQKAKLKFESSKNWVQFLGLTAPDLRNLKARHGGLGVMCVETLLTNPPIDQFEFYSLTYQTKISCAIALTVIWVFSLWGSYLIVLSRDRN